MQQAINNDLADHEADKAIDILRGPNMKSLSAFLVERHSMYIALTKAVHAIIARTHLASCSLTENPNFVPALPRPQTTIHFQAPCFLSAPLEGHRINVKATQATH